MRKNYLLVVGCAIPAVFFVTTFLCGFVQGGYDHFSRRVSELGTIGTKSQHLFTAGLLLSAILSVLFIIGLLRACRQLKLSAWPVLLILPYTVSVAGAAIFPLPLPMHLIMGSPAFLLLLSPLLGIILWPKSRLLANIRWTSVISLLIMALGLSAYLPGLLASYPGLKQRFFHVGWAVWFIYLGIAFSRSIEDRRLAARTPFNS